MTKRRHSRAKKRACRFPSWAFRTRLSCKNLAMVKLRAWWTRTTMRVSKNRKATTRRRPLLGLCLQEPRSSTRSLRSLADSTGVSPRLVPILFPTSTTPAITMFATLWPSPGHGVTEVGGPTGDGVQVYSYLALPSPSQMRAGPGQEEEEGCGQKGNNGYAVDGAGDEVDDDGLAFLGLALSIPPVFMSHSCTYCLGSSNGCSNDSTPVSGVLLTCRLPVRSVRLCARGREAISIVADPSSIPVLLLSGLANAATFSYFDQSN